MMIFQQYWAWLSARLNAYIGVHAAQTAAALEPAVVTLAVVSVMAWGYLHLRGKIEEPVLEGATRLLVIAVVLGSALKLWAYNDVIVDVFFRAPADLAANLVGATDPVTLVDQIWTQGGSAAGILWSKGSVLSSGIGLYVAALAIYVLVGFVCVYVMFLISLSRIALAVLLGLGPLFIAMVLFPQTRRFFEAWIHELANYALVTVLTVMVTALLLDLLQAYAEQTAALGDALMSMDALNLVVTAGLVLMVLRQVLPIAARLAGGFALSTGGVVERWAQRLSMVAIGAAAAAVSSDDEERPSASLEMPDRINRIEGAV
jgi:type IV secretion system protein VirB6